MNPIFSVSTEDILRLDDAQSRELVARLCRAHLRDHGCSESGVHWGGDQRAKDGGVDVRVENDPPTGIGGYLSNDRTVFQVKAEKFGPAQIPKEMAPKGKLRPAISDLGEGRGEYVIVSTRDSCSDPARTNRIEAMSKCLTKHGVGEKVSVNFFDCRKLADWIEQHPEVAIWVKHALGISLYGWRPYGPWAHREEDVDGEYLVDERAKIFTPKAEAGIAALFAINQMRGDLSDTAAVRLVGLSGVGKTRLVQALFDARVETDNPALNPDVAIYVDLADDPTPQPAVMLEALLGEAANSVVVVDNCGADSHQRLAEKVTRPGSKLRLVTVEYDIRDDLPEGTHCYRLEGSSGDLIKQLLKHRGSTLSDSDTDKIAEFSDGNARIAFALAATVGVKGELARLRDSDLFARLFDQKHEGSSELLRCAEAASLLFSFDGEDTSCTSEMSVLASLASVSILEFSRSLQELRRRGLLQQRGVWRAVLPHAISNRLAANAIESLPSAMVTMKLVENAPPRVARSFSRRLGYLHESEGAIRIAEDWLKPDGRLGDLASLADYERQMFANIAPIHQRASLDALCRATEDPSSLPMRDSHGSIFTQITRSLAYDPELFDEAVAVLVRFARVEPETNDGSSACRLLSSLFSCQLSGTEAQPEQRAAFVRELISQEDLANQDLGVDLLKAGLEVSHINAFHDFDFGARTRGFGWRPLSRDDLRAWYERFVTIAVDVGIEDSRIAGRVRVLLGQALRGLWVEADLREAIEAAARRLVSVDGWPDGWLGVKQTLESDAGRLSEDSRTRLIELEAVLAPRDLETKIRAMVLVDGAFTDDPDPGDSGADSAVDSYHRSQENAETLGRAAAMAGELLYQLLPDALRVGVDGKIYQFGRGVGLHLEDVHRLLDHAKKVIGRAESGAVSLLFVRGLMAGWHSVSPSEATAFLDGAVTDDVWGDWLPELQLTVAFDESCCDRLLRSLAVGKAPSWQYRYLGAGRATDPLTVNQIQDLIGAIAAKPDGGLPVAMDVLGMVVRCSKEKGAEYGRQLAAVCLAFLQEIDWSRCQVLPGTADHDLESISNLALASAGTDIEILDLLHRIVALERSLIRSYSPRRRGILGPFFRHYPKQALDAVFVADDDGGYRYAMEIVSAVGSGSQEAPMSQIPDDALIEWCKESPHDRFEFAAHHCRLFEKLATGEREATDDLAVSNTAVQMLEEAPDKGAVLQVLIDRFEPRCYSGARSVILKKRLLLVADLNPTEDKALSAEVAQAEAFFRATIAADEASEDTAERTETGSFE